MPNLEAENASLTAQVGRMREALEKIADADQWVEYDRDENECHVVGQFAEIARAALSPTEPEGKT